VGEGRSMPGFRRIEALRQRFKGYTGEVKGPAIR
jgi:hypothetical protein